MELLPPLSPLTSWIKAFDRSANQAPDPHSRESSPSVGFLEPLEEENLAVYSLDGTYGRRALELAKLEFAKENARRQRTMSLNNKLASNLSSGLSSPTSHRLRNPTTTTSSQLAESSIVYRDQIYRFDGLSSALLVPSWVYQRHQEPGAALNSSHSKSSSSFVFGSRQTISFWMRHSPSNNQHQDYEINHSVPPGTDSVRENPPDPTMSPRSAASDQVNEHLLCATGVVDGDIKYALAIEPDCRLSLKMSPLEGTDPSTSDRFIHWRWSLSRNEACDSKWHLYSLNVDYPSAELYLDGEQAQEGLQSRWLVTTRGHDHQPHEQHESPGAVKLSIGGCLAQQGQLKGNIGHLGTFGLFRGQLSGLTLLRDQNDDSQIIECLGQCSESLISMESSSSSSSSADSSQPLRPTTNSALQRDQSDTGRAPRTKPDNSLISYQESQSRINVVGHDFVDLEEALSQIAYINRRQLPSIGRRYLILEARVECTNHNNLNNQDLNRQASSPAVDQSAPLAASGIEANQETAAKVMRLDPIRIQIDVLPSKTLPSIVLSGTNNLAREYSTFIQGFRLFSSLSLRVRKIQLWSPDHSNNNNEAHQLRNNRQQSTIAQQQPGLPEDPGIRDYLDDPAESSSSGSSIRSSSIAAAQLNSNAGGSSMKRIEACSLRVSPTLEPEDEQLELPMDQIETLHLYWRQSSDGALIYGLDTAQAYEKILQSIVYRNKRPQVYEERSFKLLCSDMNGRLVSNEYSQRLSIIHPNSNPRSLIVGSSPGAGFPGLKLSSHEPSMSSLMSSLRRHEPLDFMETDDEHQLYSLGARAGRLDRIALAFLVFVISLVIIMILITITNLRDPEPASPTRQRRRHAGRRQEANDDSHTPFVSSILYYDIDSDGQKGAQVGCFAHSGSSIRINEDGELEEELDEFETMQAIDNDQLAWDEQHDEIWQDHDEYPELEEALEDAEATIIVMNPLQYTNQTDSTQPEMANSSGRVMVIEQRSIAGPARNHLTNYQLEMRTHKHHKHQLFENHPEDCQLKEHASDHEDACSSASGDCSSACISDCEHQDNEPYEIMNDDDDEPASDIESDQEEAARAETCSQCKQHSYQQGH